VDARGVSYPGHFLVRSSTPTGAIFIDPFEGVPLDEESLLALYQRATGEDGPIDPRRLEPASRKQILLRMLNNLRGIYQARTDQKRLQDVLMRMSVLAPSEELRREIDRLGIAVPTPLN
jgi:regulator of sirC expression with transglutaminase-like and TPR domain